jgi:hypothetical protein
VPVTVAEERLGTPRSTAWPGASRRALDRGAVAVVLLALVLNGFWLWWGLPLDRVRPWEIDGIAPMEPLATAHRLFVEERWNAGHYKKYPLAHYFILMGASAPYVAYLWLTGGLQSPVTDYPYGFEDPQTALTVLVLIGRAVSALMGIGIVLLIYLSARDLAGRRAAIGSALTVALSPAFIYYAHTTNVDTPTLFWCALGLFAFVRLVQGRTELRHYLLLGFAVGMAAATKEQAAGMFLLVPASVVALHARHLAEPGGPARRLVRAALAPPLLGALAASILTFIVATHLVFDWAGNLIRYRWRLQGIHPKWGTDYPFAWSEVAGPLDALRQAAAYTADAMNPVLFLVAVAGLLVLPFRHRWARHVAVPLLSYLGFAVLLFPFFRARFVMQLVLVLALFAGPVLAEVWRRAARRPALGVALAAAAVYSFAYGFDVNYLMMRDARYAAEAWFGERAPGTTVETYGNPVYLPRLPRHLEIRHHDVTAETLAGLAQRAPDYVVLTSAHYRHLRPGSPEETLVARLLGGDFGYRPVRTFATPPLLTPPLVQGLSPDVVVLGSAP